MPRKKHYKSPVAYKNRYNAEKYDRIYLTVPKGQKEAVQAHADRLDGGSVNGFVNRAISETMERDRQKL